MYCMYVIELVLFIIIIIRIGSGSVTCYRTLELNIVLLLLSSYILFQFMHEKPVPFRGWHCTV